MRRISDELCTENGLTVITNPKGRTPRSIYFAEKNGDPTKYNLMRSAIDYAVSVSLTVNDFKKALKYQGYVIKASETRKYPIISSVNGGKPVRLYHLGREYELDSIQKRLERGRFLNKTYHDYAVFQEITKRSRTKKPHVIRMHGSISRGKRITGLRALYFVFAYQMGVLPKNKQHKPLSPEMREAMRRLDRYSEQTRLVMKYKLDDIPSVERFIDETQSVMNEVKQRRSSIYITSCAAALMKNVSEN